MDGYVITTDNNSDLPEEFYQKYQVGCTYLSYSIDGQTYTKEDFLPTAEFYARMRAGAMPTTAQVNPEAARALMEPYLIEGKDILHIAFSSGLSGSYASCCVAAEDLSEKYPQRKILVVDSLCASLGQGLLVYHAVKLKEAGKSMEEVVQWLESHRKNLVHLFTVDDLDHLHRGGRVSKATAIVGGMLNIKPVLHVDKEGRLVSIAKARGRQASLKALVDQMEQTAIDPHSQTVFISHGDCLEDAQTVAQMVRERFGVRNIWINYIGPVIGAHSGPGTLALFYVGTER